MRIVQCYILQLRSIKYNKKEYQFLWVTQKSIEVEERLAQKREELEKEINKNKFQLVNICK